MWILSYFCFGGIIIGILIWDYCGSAELNQFVYPNPFVIDSYNFINGDGHVRFVYSGQDISSSIDIFDFSMDLVSSVKNPSIINGQIEFIWNGRNRYNQLVKNGVYFCRLNYNGYYKWVKLAVIRGA